MLMFRQKSGGGKTTSFEKSLNIAKFVRISSICLCFSLSTFYSSDVFAGRGRNSNKRFASSGKNSRRQAKTGTNSVSLRKSQSRDISLSRDIDPYTIVASPATTSSVSTDSSAGNNYSNLLATVKMLSNRIDELEKKIEEKDTSNYVDLRVVDLENRVKALENNLLSLDEVKLTDEQQKIVENFRRKYLHELREGVGNLTDEEIKSQLSFLSENQIRELIQRIKDIFSIASSIESAR